MQPSERITFASVPDSQSTCDSRGAKGLSITTHSDSRVLQRLSLHAVPLQMSGRKYLHFLIRLDIQTSRRFYQWITHKQRQRFLLPPHPLKHGGAVCKQLFQSNLWLKTQVASQIHTRHIEPVGFMLQQSSTRTARGSTHISAQA